jgi:hypothetical protein
MRDPQAFTKLLKVLEMSKLLRPERPHTDSGFILIRRSQICKTLMVIDSEVPVVKTVSLDLRESVMQWSSLIRVLRASERLLFHPQKKYIRYHQPDSCC